MIYYKQHQLHKNSQAYQLYLNWQKTKQPQDRKLLDEHLKRIEHEELTRQGITLKG